MKTTVSLTSNKELIGLLLNNPISFEKDENFKENGMRQYHFSKETEGFISYASSLFVITVNDEDKTVKIKSRDEKSLKEEFKLYKEENSPRPSDIIPLLKREMLEVEQGSPEWHRERDTRFTSTVPHMTKVGGDVEAIYIKEAYKIANNVGGELKERIISSIITEYEAEKLGYEWEAPMTRGNRLEPIVRDRLSEQLGETIVEDGLNTLDDFDYGDSGDGTFISSKDISIGDKKILKGEKVIIEIKNPSFKNFINENYVNSPSKFQQNQTHIIVGGADKVLFVKNFEGFTPIMELVELDEEYAMTFLKKLDEVDRKSSLKVDHFTQDALGNMF